MKSQLRSQPLLQETRQDRSDETVLDGITIKRASNGFKYYVTVNFFEDGTPAQVFVKIAKQGSELAGFVSALCITITLALQSGVPWHAISDRFIGFRFGMNSTEREPSLLDGIARAIDRACIKRNDDNCN